MPDNNSENASPAPATVAAPSAGNPYLEYNPVNLTMSTSIAYNFSGGGNYNYGTLHVSGGQLWAQPQENLKEKYLTGVESKITCKMPADLPFDERIKALGACGVPINASGRLKFGHLDSATGEKETIYTWTHKKEDTKTAEEPDEEDSKLRRQINL